MFTKLEIQKRYRETHRKELAAANRDYYKRNKAARLESQNRRRRIRTKTDPLYRLKNNRRRRRNKVIHYIANSKQDFATLKDIGCSITEWRSYLETKFDSNMTWENYGSVWHLDEIIPISAWDLNNPIHWKACWHYLNSQPLLSKDNQKKGGKQNKDYSKEIEDFLCLPLFKIMNQ
jgi:hypothetical protein